MTTWTDEKCRRIIAEVTDDDGTLMATNCTIDAAIEILQLRDEVRDDGEREAEMLAAMTELRARLQTRIRRAVRWAWRNRKKCRESQANEADTQTAYHLCATNRLALAVKYTNLAQYVEVQSRLIGRLLPVLVAVRKWVVSSSGDINEVVAVLDDTADIEVK